jgi:hypothetical protein
MMDFQAFSFIFNRALVHTFSRTKLFFVFILLAMSGLLVVFFHGLSLHAGPWVMLSLTFLPIFICTGILLSMGILLIRMYYDELKQRDSNIWTTLSHSWEIVIGASYFALPIIFSYMLLWMLMGIFVLLREIPLVGDFFGIVLAFAPFLINLGTLVLCLIAFALLFFVAPLIALKGLERGAVFQMAVKRLEYDPFANCVLIIVALLPLALVTLLLMLSAYLTGGLCPDCHNSLQAVLKWFFIMVPFTACLTPGVIFFFNFAAEAHALMQKNMRS